MTAELDENQLNHISPNEAFDMIQRDTRALFVDIRSNMEFLFVGHPKGAIHVPWIDEPDWTINKNFVKEIRQLLLGGVSQDHGSPPIILICRSGKRSQEAGAALLQAGLKNVCHISEGFEGDLDETHHRGSVGGWRFHGLPWEQC
jgi:rhodanese-related sulfurtransferase